MGVSERTYQRYESGKGNNEPSHEQLILVADYFDVTTDYLLGRTKSYFRIDEPHTDSSLSESHVDAIQELIEETHFEGTEAKEVTHEKWEAITPDLVTDDAVPDEMDAV